MTEQAGPEAVGPAAFGRVESDGTVYVRTSAGERVVGQVPDVPAAEALGFFTRRFEALDLEVSLLERRIATGALSPDDAVASITKVRAAVAEARAVGDLDGLQARLEALFPLIAEPAGSSQGRTSQAAARRRGPQRRGSFWRPSALPPAMTGAAESTAFVCCLRSGSRYRDSIVRPTTRCGTGSPVRVPPTRGAARPSSPSRTSSARRRG